MDTTRPWKRALAGAFALTLLVAACGDDDGEATSEDTESTEASDESTTEPEETTTSEETTESTEAEGSGTEGDPEAVATAEAINLKIEDFAEGWVEEEQSDSTEADPVDECFTGADIEGTRVGEATSPDFSVEVEEGSTQGQAVSMKTALFDSPESATAVVDEVGTDAFATCVTDYLSNEVLDGVEAQLEPVVDDPPLGEQSAGLAGAIAIPGSDGSTTQGLIDMHVIRTAEAVSFTLTLDTLGDQTFQQTLAELYTVIADRQAAEVG